VVFNISRLLTNGYYLLFPFITVTKYYRLKPSCLNTSGKELFSKMHPENTGFDFQGNNVWPMHMPLRTSRISRPPLMG